MSLAAPYFASPCPSRKGIHEFSKGFASEIFCLFCKNGLSRRGENRERGRWREIRRGLARRRSGVDEVAEMEMAPPKASAEFAQDLATDAGRDDRRVPAQSTVR